MNPPMDQNSHSPRDRWLAIGLLLALLVLVFLIVILPLLSLTAEYRESADDLAFKLDRLKRVAAQKKPLLQEVVLLKEEHAERSDNFFSQPTTALAGADIQKIVKDAVTKTDGTLISTQLINRQLAKNTASPTIGATPQPIVVRARIKGDIEMLRALLIELASVKPLLFIESLTLRAEKKRRNPKTRKLEVSDQLNINFEVVGYYRH